MDLLDNYHQALTEHLREAVEKSEPKQLALDKLYTFHWWKKNQARAYLDGM